MNCSHARKILYPEPTKCEVTIEHAAAQMHVHECSACNRYFREQTEWSQLLKEKVGTEEAPEPLREQVQKAIARHRETPPQGRIQRRRRALVAALAAVMFLPAAWLAWQAVKAPSASLLQDLCKDHANYLSERREVESSEPEVIESWLRQKTRYAVHVPAFEDTELLGGRLCFLRGRQAALVFYRKSDRPVSLFQFSEEGVRLRTLNQSVIEGVPIWHGAFQGYNVVAFAQRGMIYALVSDLRESELLQLASEAQVQSRGH